MLAVDVGASAGAVFEPLPDGASEVSVYTSLPLAAAAEVSASCQSARDDEIEVQLDGNTYRYRVFDTTRDRWVEGAVSFEDNWNLLEIPITANGVVAWTAHHQQLGTTLVDYVAYDAGRGDWVHGRTELVAGWISSEVPTNSNGVVAWTTHHQQLGTTLVDYVAYDAGRGDWVHGRTEFVAGWITSEVPTNSNGVVAWTTHQQQLGTTFVDYVTYDPIRNDWMHDRTPLAANWTISEPPVNSDGVVAWTAHHQQLGTTEVDYVTYDPARSDWVHDKMDHVADFTATAVFSSEGVVAWTVASQLLGRQTVLFTLYDPVQRRWVDGSESYVDATLGPLSILDGTVDYRVDGVPQVKGYHSPSHAWHDGPTVPRALFHVSVEEGEAPLSVWFLDNSIAPISWTWLFGDSATCSTRNAFHTFVEPGDYNVVLTVDGSGGSDSLSRTVRVTGNRPPTDIELSETSVAENVAVQTSVGTLSTADPDPQNTFTYSLVSGEGDTDNGAFEITGNLLQTATTLDFETQPSYSIRVQSTDQGGLSTEAHFTLTVLDVNEPPAAQLRNTITTLDENTTARTKVADIVIVDDNLGHETLTLRGDDAALFEIAGAELFLKGGQKLDAENNPELNVSVAVDDPTVGGMPDDIADLQITVVEPSPWQNQLLHEDVDGDSYVAPIDLLLVINDLNKYGSRRLDGHPNQPSPDHFVDVDGDRFVAPIDVLIVINYLNRRGTTAVEAEGGVSKETQLSTDGWDAWNEAKAHSVLNAGEMSWDKNPRPNSPSAMQQLALAQVYPLESARGLRNSPLPLGLEDQGFRDLLTDLAEEITAHGDAGGESMVGESKVTATKFDENKQCG